MLWENTLSMPGPACPASVLVVCPVPFSYSAAPEGHPELNEEEKRRHAEAVSRGEMRLAEKAQERKSHR